MQPIPAPVLHRTININGIEIFYREAGPEHAPVVLLPHGYPSSSFQFRNFMPALADRWRLIAPTIQASATAAHPTGLASPIRSTDTPTSWSGSRPR